MTFGGPEILIILAVIILFFGAKKIPELARGIGEGINEFQKVKDDTESGELEEDSSNTVKN